MTTVAANMEVEGRNSYKAGAAITANRLVKLSALDSDGNVTIIPTAAITDVPIGVSLETVANGEMCPIQTRGVAKVEFAASASFGAQVMPDGGGGGLAATAAGATAKSCGILESAPGGANEMGAVRLAVPNVNGPANA